MISRLPPAAAFAQPLALSVSLPDGALFTKNEPTLTHNVPESTVYLSSSLLLLYHLRVSTDVS